MVMIVPREWKPFSRASPHVNAKFYELGRVSVVVAAAVVGAAPYQADKLSNR